MPKLVAYIRVSTGQQEAAYGPQAQLERIKTWAETHDAQIAKTFTEAISGVVAGADRPILTDAIAYARSHNLDGLIFADASRVARDAMQAEGLYHLLWNFGLSIYLADLGEVDRDDPARAFIRQMFALVAEYERAMIRVRTHGARKLRAKRGLRLTGKYPFGYVESDGKITQDESEQFQRSIMDEGRAKGAGWTKIARALNEAGYRTRRGNEWSGVSVKYAYEAGEPALAIIKAVCR